jgi:hypothetical protein
MVVWGRFDKLFCWGGRSGGDGSGSDLRRNVVRTSRKIADSLSGLSGSFFLFPALFFDAFYDLKYFAQSAFYFFC